MIVTATQCFKHVIKRLEKFVTGSAESISKKN